MNEEDTEEALTELKKAYVENYKRHGWDSVSQKLKYVLCLFIGDEKFCEWVKDVE